MTLNSLDELIKALGSEYDGRGVYLNIGGSQGVSYGEMYISLDRLSDIEDLANYFNQFTYDWCMDYVDDYIDSDELAEAEDEGDWDRVDEIRDEALTDCVADCGRRYVTGLYNDAKSIEIDFNGCYFRVWE